MFMTPVHKENAIYALAAIEPNPLLRDGAYGVVMMDVQKAHEGIHH